MRFSRLNFILAVSLLVIFTLLASGIFAYHTSCRGRILYGVQSEGRSLFGLTQKEAEQYFTQLGKKKLASQTVSLRSNGAVWKIQPQEVNLQPAAAAADPSDRFPRIGKQFFCLGGNRHHGKPQESSGKTRRYEENAQKDKQRQIWTIQEGTPSFVKYKSDTPIIPYCGKSYPCFRKG